MSSNAAYSPFVVAGDWIAVSGQIGAVNGVLAAGFEEQSRLALANLEAHLVSAGATLADIVKVTVFLHDLDDYPALNEVFVAAFGAHPPARSAIAVAGLPFGSLVEIEAWAHLPGQSRAG